jgi:hypothetical protein
MEDEKILLMYLILDNLQMGLVSMFDELFITY